MKRLIILTLLLTSNALASEEECSGRFINNRCLTISPFDVSFSKYNEGFSSDALYDGQGNYLGINIKSFMTSNTYAFMQGMERYAEEMTEWYDVIERQMDEEYVLQKNSILNDNYAYAIVDGIQFNINNTSTGKQRYYFDGDIVSGNDWDNNGLIDMLEDTLFISHTNGYIKEN